MDTNLIVWIAFGVITAIVLIFTLIFGFKRTALQSGIRLAVLAVTVLIAALVAAYVTNMAVTYSIEYVQNGEVINDSTVKEVLDYISGTGTAPEHIRNMVAALVAPLVFFAVFIVLNLLFLIIYSIVGAFTFSQGHKKRMAKREGGKYKATKGNRWISLGLNLVTCFAIAAFILVPVTYYVPLVSNAMDAAEEMQTNSDNSESSYENEYELSADVTAVAASSSVSSSSSSSSSSTDQAKEILRQVSSNPIVKVYGAVGGVVSENVSRVKTTDGSTMKLSEVVEKTYPVVSSLMDIANSGDMTSLTAADIYNIANKLADNAFADEILGGILSDAATKWSEGQTFLGQKAPDLDADLMDGIYAALKDGKNASDTIKAVGHVYAVAEVMGVFDNNSSNSTSDSTTAKTSKDKVLDLINNLNDDSIDIVTSVVTSAIETSVGENAGFTPTQLNKISEFVKDLLTELKEVKTQSDETKNKEAENVGKIFEAVQDVSKINSDEAAKEYIKCIQNSTVLIKALKKFVADNKDPMNIGSDLSESSKESILKELDELQITKGSDLYNIVLDLFGIDD